MEELDAWYASFEDEATPALTEAQKQMGKQRLFNQLDQLTAEPPKQHRLPLLRYASAAAVLLIITGTFLFWPSSKREKEEIQLATTVDVAPGGDKAVLTLADGRKIILEDSPDGQVAAEGNMTIIKLNSGMLAYQNTAKNANAASQLNTINTPVGGQFQVILSDGTKVWLNAASSITFPNQFNGKVREVSTTGETYFEVATLKNGSKEKVPFRVSTGEQKIEVLGTQFNINAYGDQKQYQTTLVEGSIRLSQNKITKLLQPGQQASIQLEKDIINISETDVEKAIAWKNGLFKFDNTDIMSLMKQLERWYPIEVVYEGKIPDERFFGKIERNYTLSEVLKVLQLGQVHFKIDDKTNTNGKRKLIVMP
ncbi:FecR family protein [Pedobacter xixiisoli]|nr:FecR family protein [Pedobacter xixiisoli]